jgi:hypothetical protein
VVSRGNSAAEKLLERRGDWLSEWLSELAQPNRLRLVTTQSGAEEAAKRNPSVNAGL